MEFAQEKKLSAVVENPQRRLISESDRESRLEINGVFVSSMWAAIRVRPSTL